MSLHSLVVPLSVQVHPEDDPSRGITGKEEAWIVLDAEPDAVVLAGLAEGVDMSRFEAASRAAVADPSRQDALMGCLRALPARPGMIILVPARTPHAIGPGILLAEIQQPADCTYRIFDYGSGRDLHTDLALATVTPEAQPRLWQEGEPAALLAGKHLRLEPLVAKTEAARMQVLLVDVTLCPRQTILQRQAEETADESRKKNRSRCCDVRSVIGEEVSACPSCRECSGGGVDAPSRVPHGGGGWWE